ncbi:MAG: TrmH family RNA methyltransferase [Planctomycetes bacterium]|nr:TrmH family RNA methyltransferase [Planctomycetota bacterium]
MVEFEEDYVQVRQRNFAALERPRELVVACAPMRSQVNLGRIARMAGCCAVERLIVCGGAHIDPKIARDAATTLRIEERRSLAPVLARLREEGYMLVGLEQAEGSVNIHDFAFPRRTALVVGNERTGLLPEDLKQLHQVVEIPVYGPPAAYNAATAAIIGLYEFCRQHPHG